MKLTKEQFQANPRSAMEAAKSETVTVMDGERICAVIRVPQPKQDRIPKDLTTLTRSKLLEMADQTLYVLTRCKNYCTAYPSLPEGERDIHRLRATKRKRDHLKAEHQRILSELARRNQDGNDADRSPREHKKMQMHQRFFNLVCEEIGEIRAMEIMEMAKNA